MASRSQIVKLTARIEVLATEIGRRRPNRNAQIDPIEALAPKSDRVVYVWRNLGESAEEALERHYRTLPSDRFAGQAYIFSWLES
jgi:hypothetical protein